MKCLASLLIAIPWILNAQQDTSAYRKYASRVATIGDSAYHSMGVLDLFESIELTVGLLDPTKKPLPMTMDSLEVRINASRTSVGTRLAAFDAEDAPEGLASTHRAMTEAFERSLGSMDSLAAARIACVHYLASPTARSVFWRLCNGKVNRTITALEAASKAYVAARERLAARLRVSRYEENRDR